MPCVLVTPLISILLFFLQRVILCWKFNYSMRINIDMNLMGRESLISWICSSQPSISGFLSKYNVPFASFIAIFCSLGWAITITPCHRCPLARHILYPLGLLIWNFVHCTTNSDNLTNQISVSKNNGSDWLPLREAVVRIGLGAMCLAVSGEKFAPTENTVCDE
jgi:hypothetical protein